MKFSISIILLSLVSHLLPAQGKMEYFFKDLSLIDESIPSPEDISGFRVGERHISHAQLVRYLTLLAETSDRISIETYGYTYEERPLLLLTISDPDNLASIDDIRENHLKLSDPDRSGSIEISEQPIVIWMGYSVHGNEASGTNASLLVAWYLAASQSEETKNLLKNSVILMDPCINPDGYSRFAQWVNQFRSSVRITDPASLELNEPWPGGRTNHYWFDLNRDWLLLQHPESKARIAQFHKWRPNILTDHHEMGSNATFFFQPGIPSRNNPNTPPETYRLTAEIAEYHASALDDIGSLYYSKESFDDFYYGKGSTYPDINGGIGILFEQASVRGHARETEHGILKFPFAIRNQLTVSLSTLKAGIELKNDILNQQKDFFIQGEQDASDDPVKAYLIDFQGDNTKKYYFLDLLSGHEIDVYTIENDTRIDDHLYKADNSIIIPTQQQQYRLIKTLFEDVTSFTDSLFYDVSAWSILRAFDVQHDDLRGKSYAPSMISEKIEEINLPKGSLTGKSSYGYIFRWDQYHSPRALFQIQQKNILTKTAQEEFVINTGESFKPGAIFIPVQYQVYSPDSLYSLLTEIAIKTGINFYAVSSGYTQGGIDLGSPNLETLKKPEIMMMVGDGISSYDAGSIWHLLDQRFRIPVSLVTIETFNTIDINRYNTIILPNGNYSGISDKAKEKLRSWTENGGNIIAIEGASRWLSNQKLAFLKFRSAESDTLSQLRYKDLRKDRGAQVIAGTIFGTRLDLTHPLCYGYPDEKLPVFKSNRTFFERSNNPYNTPVMYTDDPLISGYISDDNYDLIKGSSAVIVNAIGRGRVISFSDTPNFRAYWYGTNRLFFNALFFGDLISWRSAR